MSLQSFIFWLRRPTRRRFQVTVSGLDCLFVSRRGERRLVPSWLVDLLLLRMMKTSCYNTLTHRVSGRPFSIYQDPCVHHVVQQKTISWNDIWSCFCTMMRVRNCAAPVLKRSVLCRCEPTTMMKTALFCSRLAVTEFFLRAFDSRLAVTDGSHIQF